MPSADLTYGQYVGIVITAVFSSVLSIIGSCAIIRVARKKLKNTQHQILFCLSVADILTSTTALLFNFLIPEGVLDARWAFGTDGTCAATGFSYIWFSTAASIYNCMLSMHFWRMIRRKTPSQQTDDRWFLGLGHFAAVFVPLVPAIGGAITDTYHEHVLLYICYLEEEPSGCGLLDDYECEKGEIAYTLRNIHMLIICVSAIISVACTIAVYCKVRASSFGNRSGMTGSLGEAAARRQREVRTQVVLYTCVYINNIFWLGVGSFFIMVTPETINRRGSPGVYFLQWMIWFCIPLQGALNFTVYVRPDFSAWRRHLGKDAPFLTVLRKAASGDPPPRRSAKNNYRRRSSQSTKRSSSQLTSVPIQNQPLDNFAHLSQTFTPPQQKLESQQETASTTAKDEEDEDDPRSLVRFASLPETPADAEN